ncbi:hypothetical protein GCM10022234_09820 [Aeromicrobium panaciterrae]|uniref:fibronectin type III domain-containing protein n=1 Tax=Aeromicrobium panaciterrae TaxID=363861 RepID=UPI0031E385EA
MISWTRHACRASALALAIPLIVGAPAGAATTLGAPTGLAATVTSSSATLSWAKAANAKTYVICLQKSKAAKTCFKTARTTSTKVSFSKLAPTDGTDYFFRVTAQRDKAVKRSVLKGFNLAKPVTRPAAATGITRTATTTSVAISWNTVAGATGYTVCLLPTPTAPACSHRSTLSPSTTASFTGLTTQPGTDFYYRVISHNTAGQTSSATLSFDLAVATVTGLTAKTDGKQHLVLTWSPATNASKYAVQIATDKAMTTGVVGGTATSPTFTSPALRPGTLYYFRVRGTNDAVAGTYSAIGELKFGTPGTAVRIVTYNLCGQDKCLTSTNKMKTWSSTRKPLAGSLVRSAAPDIVATQESTTKDTNFATQLPGFKLSHYKSAKSLFYKTSKYSLVSSGEITLSSSLKKYAVWADLKDLNGTRFIVVNLHLVAGKGKANDDERTREMTALINGVRKINPSGLPVVYAGDFNSNDSNANQSKYKGGYDAPLRSFKAIGVVDSYSTSKTLINQIWNSANQAKNPPLKHSDHVDHVYTSPDVKATSWKVLLRLSGTSHALPFASDHNALVVDLTVPGR